MNCTTTEMSQYPHGVILRLDYNVMLLRKKNLIPTQLTHLHALQGFPRHTQITNNKTQDKLSITSKRKIAQVFFFQIYKVDLFLKFT